MFVGWMPVREATTPPQTFIHIRQLRYKLMLFINKNKVTQLIELIASDPMDDEFQSPDVPCASC